MILTLAPFRDRLTQILWGLADYEYRFGRKAEAIWLPETACNADVLRILIDLKLRYVILSPSQAAKIRKPQTREWLDVGDGSIDPRRPYFWTDRTPEGVPIPVRQITLFFYDGGISRAIAFENAMKDSAAMASRLDAAFDPGAEEDQLVHVATDGETYGHHHKFSDLTLAHMFRHELARRGMEITNYAAYLDAHPAQWEADIKPGPNGEGTSWSCSHGVNRWQADCGCGAENGENQRWRAPLRTALDWLNGELTRIFESEGGAMFRSPWDARNDYIAVMLDRSHRNISFFMEKHCKGNPDMQETVRALKLLEMQKFAMYMFTSCGWFFSELSRIETVQNMKYAARAIELAASLGHEGLEEKFLELLAQATSNLPNHPNGAEVYRRMALASRMNEQSIIAEYGMNMLFSASKELALMYHYKFSLEARASKTVNAYHFAAGLLDLKNVVTTERSRAVFCAIYTPASMPTCYISYEDTEQKFSTLSNYLRSMTAERIWEGIGPAIEGIMGAQIFDLRDMIPEMRVRILKLMHRSRLHSLSETHMSLFNEYMPMVEQWRALNLPVPRELRQEVESGACQFVLSRLEQFRINNDGLELDSLAEMLPRIRACDIDINHAPLRQLFGELLAEMLTRLHDDPTSANIRNTVKLINNARNCAISHWIFDAQNRALRLFEYWQKKNFEPLLAKNGSCPECIMEAAGIYSELGICMDLVHESIKTASSKIRTY